jgi:energy-coupling factor transport system permease protein
MKFFSHIQLGKHYPVDSVIHRLGAPVKILGVLFLTLAIFIVNSGYSLVAFAMLLLILVLVSGLPPFQVLRGIRSVLVILTITVLVQLLFAPGRVLWRMGPFNITNTGVINGAFYSLRILLLTLLVSLLTLTTSPTELLHGLQVLLKPLRAVHLPVHRLAMVLMLAFRFLPVLLTRAEEIVISQVSRGADFESRNPLRRVKSLVPLLIPLFVACFRDAEELSVAMACRGYRGAKERTSYRETRLHPQDLLALFLIITFCVIIPLFFG